MADSQDVVQATAEDQQQQQQQRPRQRVVREPDEETIGPFFPSGMSAPEAAVAGATADLDEETRNRIESGRNQTNTPAVTSGGE